MIATVGGYQLKVCHFPIAACFVYAVPIEERNKLNRLLGYPEPPTTVYALGRDGSAAVWWDSTEPNIIKWELKRYRKDRTKPDGGWYDKGYVVYEGLERTQLIMPELTNNYEYRFTVRAYNAKGKSNESEPSNEVMVEAALPPGWYRFFDPNQRRHFYANIKTSQSSWTRPEEDPYMLDESIVLNFERRELKFLRELFDEDIAHFKCVTHEQMMDIMREIGESCSKRWIRNLMRGYGDNAESLHSWVTFMEIIHHIKNYRKKTAEILSNPGTSFFNFFARAKAKAAMGQKNKLGVWIIEHNALADRTYYKNTETGKSAWTMPDEIRYYIPPNLEQKLLQTFNYGQIEEFKHFFNVLDVDSSGDLSAKEIRLLLQALDISVGESEFNRLIYSLDTNGNGTIEFDEFCFMMLEIYKRERNGIFKGVNMGGNGGGDVATAAPPLGQLGRGNSIEKSSGSLLDDSSHGKQLNSALGNIIGDNTGEESKVGGGDGVGRGNGGANLTLGGVGNAISLLTDRLNPKRRGRSRNGNGWENSYLTKSMSFRDFSFSTSFRSFENDSNRSLVPSPGGKKGGASATQTVKGCRFLCCICGGKPTPSRGLNTYNDVNDSRGDLSNTGMGAGDISASGTNSQGTMFAVAMSRKSNRLLTANEALMEFSAKGDASAGRSPNKGRGGGASSGSQSPVKVVPLSSSDDSWDDSARSLGSASGGDFSRQDMDYSAGSGSQAWDDSLSASGANNSKSRSGAGGGNLSQSQSAPPVRKKKKEQKHQKFCMCGCRRY